MRLGRLDKTKIQLEEFLSVHREAVPPPASPALPIAYDRALWLRGASASRRAMLPPLPFMVPSVIEALLRSEWHEKVHVVAEEADVACARSAKSSASIILSNDSDLSVYDLGNGSLALLDTLEKSRDTHAGGSSIRASLIRPADIAKRLSVPSIQTFAYERSLASSASITTIADRARRTSMSDRAYRDFIADHVAAESQWKGLHLKCLDPRTAEFVVQATTGEVGHVPKIYLPILHEDPERDSSWSYGQEVRQLAYSLFFELHPRARPASSVNEYSRKGGRITSTSVEIIDRHRLQQASSALLDLLQQNKPSTVLQWWFTALRLVIRRKIEISKIITQSNVETVFGLQGSSSSCTWIDMHLHASIQSALYSLRMLQQLLSYASQSTPAADERDIQAEQLQRALEGLPAIATLFVDIEGLHSLVTNDLAEAKSSLQELADLLGDDVSAPAEVTGRANRGERDPVDKATDMLQPALKRCKKDPKASTQTAPSSSNMFDLLAGDDTDGSRD